MVGTDLVGGRYRLLELIGTGGMGRVWRARDELLQRTVAVKEFAVPASGQTVREARAAARLDHPGVVKVFDVIEQGGESWIVMEYVASRSLYRAVRDDGPFPPPEAARIGLHVLAALRAAHDAGVLHRDVKPDNVLLATDGRIVLGDFGLATIGREDGPDPRLGSPHYIAPERLMAQDSGVPADLWSFGAMLYVAVEGRPPFARGDAGSALRAVLEDPPDPPELAGPLSAVILALLDKDPQLRPSAAEVDQRLRAVLNHGPFRGRARVTAGGARVPRRKARLVVASALLVLTAGGAAAAAAGNRLDAGPGLVAESSESVSGTVSREGLGAAPEPPAPLSDVCGTGVSPVDAATRNVPAGLPADWVWFRDPNGFALGLPRGWQRSTSGNNVCFTDGAGGRAFTVNVAALVTREPLQYLQSREKAERGDLPGYQRISMGVLLLQRGGADWEYTWRPDSDSVRHERRILLAVTDRRSYLLQWTTADGDWDASVRLQRRIVDRFGSAR